MATGLRSVEKTTASAESELGLLALVELGDEQAVTHLFRRHSRLVYSVAFRVLHDSAAAEDVLQEVFMQIWRTPTAFVGVHGNLGGWLATVARNRAIDVVRKRRPTESIEDFPVASTYDVFEDVQRTVLLERARTAIRELPPEQRNAVELAFFDGLSHTEIAEKLGHPVGTVKARIRSGLQSLTRALKA